MPGKSFALVMPARLVSRAALSASARRPPLLRAPCGNRAVQHPPTGSTPTSESKGGAAYRAMLRARGPPGSFPSRPFRDSAIGLLPAARTPLASRSAGHTRPLACDAEPRGFCCPF